MVSRLTLVAAGSTILSSDLIFPTGSMADELLLRLNESTYRLLFALTCAGLIFLIIGLLAAAGLDGMVAYAFGWCIGTWGGPYVDIAASD